MDEGGLASARSSDEGADGSSLDLEGDTLQNLVSRAHLEGKGGGGRRVGGDHLGWGSVVRGLVNCNTANSKTGTTELY